MDKLQRNERIAFIVKTLMDHPDKIFTLGYFTEILGAARSTVCEDIDIVEGVVSRFEMGRIETITGASGGVRYLPLIGQARHEEFLKELCAKLSSGDRILPGGFLYMLDIIYSPTYVDEIGRIMASNFIGLQLDYVVTVETKGIPVAYTTAKYLNIPLVIVRHYNEVTDGSSVNINYVSGSAKKIQTMALSIRAMKKQSRVLFIDDFMKGGGTARGIIELMREFETEVAGIGVLIETQKPEKKLVSRYSSILTLYDVDPASGVIDIRPSAF